MSERTVVERVDNLVLYSDGSMLVKQVRFSYPHTMTPQDGMVDKETGKKSAPSFSLVGMLPKATHRPAAQIIKREIDKILAEKKTNISADRKFLRDGNDSGKDAYMGHWTITVRETVTKPPKVRNVDGRTPLTAADEGPGKVIYGGCYGNILFRPWYQPGYGKRVNANFLACQVVPAKGRDASELGETNRITDEDADQAFENEADESSWETDDADVDTQGL